MVGYWSVGILESARKIVVAGISFLPLHHSNTPVRLASLAPPRSAHFAAGGGCGVVDADDGGIVGGGGTTGASLVVWKRSHGYAVSM